MFTGVNVGAIFERTLAVAAAKVATTATGAKLIKAVKDLASGILNKSSLRAWLSQGRSAITLGYNCDYFFDKVRTVYILIFKVQIKLRVLSTLPNSFLFQSFQRVFSVATGGNQNKLYLYWIVLSISVLNFSS
jgi:hypothetical protein